MGGARHTMISILSGIYRRAIARLPSQVLSPSRLPSAPPPSVSPSPLQPSSASPPTSPPFGNVVESPWQVQYTTRHSPTCSNLVMTHYSMFFYCEKNSYLSTVTLLPLPSPWCLLRACPALPHSRALSNCSAKPPFKAFLLLPLPSKSLAIPSSWQL